MIWNELLERAFSPRRPALAPALEAVRGLHEAEVAWRALVERGILPRSWLDDPRRRFPRLPTVSARDRADRLRRAPYLPSAACPDEVGACASIAADAGGIEQAERLGRSLMQAMASWGWPRPDVVMWVPSDAERYENQLHDTKPEVWEPDASVWTVFPDDDTLAAIGATIARLRAHVAESDRRGRAVCALLGPWVWAHETWLQQVRNDAKVPPRAGDGPSGERFAALVDPFELGLGILELGYCVLPSSDAILVMGYPPGPQPAATRAC